MNIEEEILDEAILILHFSDIYLKLTTIFILMKPPYYFISITKNCD